MTCTTTPIPRLGGVAIFLGFAAAMLAASHLPFLRQVFDTGELRGVLWGAGIVCLVGAIDDIHELDWLTKAGGPDDRRGDHGLPGRAVLLAAPGRE